MGTGLILHSEFGIRYSVFGIRFAIRYPLSAIRYPLSPIPYPLSAIPYPLQQERLDEKNAYPRRRPLRRITLRRRCSRPDDADAHPPGGLPQLQSDGHGRRADGRDRRAPYRLAEHEARQRMDDEAAAGLRP